MKAKLIILGILFCTALGTGLGWADDGDIVWKSGSLVPKGVGYADQIKNILKPGMLAATDGKLHLKTYYGGIMGDDEDVLKKVHIGQLQAAGSGVQLTFLVCPEMGVTNLPLLFENSAEVDFIRKEMYPVFDEIMQKRGLKLLLWLDQGFDQFYSVNQPLSSIEDFSKAKFITWCGDMEKALLDSLGATAYPVNVPEFNTTIRRGLADAYIGPPIWAVSTQMYSVVRFINTTNIRYSPAVFFVSGEAWNNLPAKYKTNIEAARESWQTPFIEGSRRDNQKCLDAMFKYGVKEIKSDDELMDQFRNRTRPIYEQMAGRVYPQEILDQVLDLLDDYRQENQ